MSRLAGKVAVVTGGASGMGRATVMRFLADGAKVVVADLNEANGAETLAVAKAQGHGDSIAFVRCDVAKEADVAAMVAEAVKRFGRLDIAYLNAGVGGAFGPIAETSVEDWDYTFAVLTRSVFLGMKHASLGDEEARRRRRDPGDRLDRRHGGRRRQPRLFGGQGGGHQPDRERRRRARPRSHPRRRHRARRDLDAAGPSRPAGEVTRSNSGTSPGPTAASPTSSPTSPRSCAPTRPASSPARR